jgi:phosphatidylserine/phosphatidylglycerophosphate/cardiolipin synthase-like enzyme
MTTTYLATSPGPLLRPGRTCWTVSPVETSGLLIDGRDYFREFVRAARSARRHILLAGWQFDSTVSLLRGRDREGTEEDPRLLPFLDGLCRRNPDLRIYLLCWDYSPAYFFQREWLQDLRFNWGSAPGIRFRFDDRHAVGASHHQKFAVIDGTLAFAGSLDFCEARWDRRAHEARCVERHDADGHDVSGPYHEVQAYFSGPAAAELVELFEARWILSGGRPLRLAPPVPVQLSPRPSARLGPGEVGLSRTMARTLEPEHPPIREIRQLYVDAIAGAETSIYIENQYFGSTAVFDALRRRLLRPDLPRLDVALVYPKELHSLTEELSIGARQSAMFRALKETAAGAGHRLGIYYSCSPDPDGEARSRYIHSKVLIVDDRFLTVGSANTNNRSMGLDSELNVSWEAREGTPMARAIGRTRLNLLLEHAGLPAREALRGFRSAGGWVEVLDGWASEGRGSLRHHPMSTRLEQYPLAMTLASDAGLDPERPLLEEDLFEEIAPSGRERVAAGIRRVRRVFLPRRGRWREVVVVNSPASLARVPSRAWAFAARTARRWLVPVFILLVVALEAWLVWLLLDAFG